MVKLLSLLTELTQTQEDKKPHLALSSSPDEKQISKSVETRNGKERSDEYNTSNTREHSIDSQAQSKKND